VSDLKAANRPQPNETTDYTPACRQAGISRLPANQLGGDYQRLEQIARNWN
jgi:hypothetical protein